VLLEDFRLSQRRSLKISGYRSSVAGRFQVVTAALLEDFRLSQQRCWKISGYHSGFA